jgi:hypothetical protein
MCWVSLPTRARLRVLIFAQVSFLRACVRMYVCARVCVCVYVCVYVCVCVCVLSSCVVFVCFTLSYYHHTQFSTQFYLRKLYMIRPVFVVFFFLLLLRIVCVLSYFISVLRVHTIMRINTYSNIRSGINYILCSQFEMRTHNGPWLSSHPKNLIERRGLRKCNIAIDAL